MIGYEIFVRSFRDGNGDGIGDIRGIIEALDYLKSLGIGLIWLTPIMKSPSYHGYDVSDYFEINPIYGDFEDLKNLISKAHSMNIKIILDIPLNHTSFLNPWFQEKPEYYIWAGEKTNINERRSWDGAPIWHPSDRGYYRGTFGRCLPDLNFENPEVIEKAKEIVKFWSELGIDGFRFDAAKHIYENHEKNLEFWEQIKEISKTNLNVAEVWDEPEISYEYAKVLGFSFNFHVFGALRKSLVDKNPRALYDALLTCKNFLKSSFNFLSNHDVSRIASSTVSEKGIIFAHSILLTMPGIPIIYYGDELGVPGIYDPEFPEDVTEPFPWTEDMCSKGQTRWKSTKYAKPFHGLSVEYQISRNSVLKHFMEWTEFRNSNPWIDRAMIEDVYLEDAKLVYTMNGEGEKLMIVHDFSILETYVISRR